MKRLTNLTKLLAELNKKDEEGNQMFDFKTKTNGGFLFIYDANENYSVNYEYDMNCMLQEAADEFGFKYEYQEDKIIKKLNEAVQKDLGQGAYIDWETHLTMVVNLGCID